METDTETRIRLVLVLWIDSVVNVRFALVVASDMRKESGRYPIINSFYTVLVLICVLIS